MIKKSKNDLTEMEYLVTQENGTEPPFQNEYWNHFEKGIYVDKISGKPLFTSEENLNQIVVGLVFLKPWMTMKSLN